VLAAAGLFGIDLVPVALGLTGAGGADPARVYPAMLLSADGVLLRMAVATLGTRLVLTIVARWGLLTSWWVTIKLLVALAPGAALVLVVLPGLGTAADATTGLSAPLPSAKLRQFATVPGVATALVVLNVSLAIAKPPWQVQRPRREPAGSSATLARLSTRSSPASCSITSTPSPNAACCARRCASCVPQVSCGWSTSAAMSSDPMDPWRGYNCGPAGCKPTSATAYRR
jgi:hypothetical protein